MPCCREEVAHRRIDVLIGPAHVVAPCSSASPPAWPSRCRRCRSDECASCVSATGCLLDRPSRRLRGRGDRPTRARRRTAASASAPVVWPDGNPNSTGPGKSASTSRDRRRAPSGCRRARRTAAARRTRAPTRAPSTPAQPQLRQHAIEPIRPLADFVEEQHAARRADRTRTASRATPRAASACRRAACRPPHPARSASSRAGASSPTGSGSAQTARRTSRGRSPPAPLRQPPVEHRPVKRDDAAAAASATSGST